MKRAYSLEREHNYCQSRHKIGSYGRDYKKWNTTLDDIMKLTEEKSTAFGWLQEMGWLNSIYQCPVCAAPMVLTKASASHGSSDGMVWKCRATVQGRRHQSERSIRKNSWLHDCNLTLEEIIKLCYFWSTEADGKTVSNKN